MIAVWDCRPGKGLWSPIGPSHPHASRGEIMQRGREKSPHVRYDTLYLAANAYCPRTRAQARTDDL